MVKVLNTVSVADPVRLRCRALDALILGSLRVRTLAFCLKFQLTCKSE
jgi:hypothetical protein